MVKHDHCVTIGVWLKEGNQSDYTIANRPVAKRGHFDAVRNDATSVETLMTGTVAYEVSGGSVYAVVTAQSARHAVQQLLPDHHVACETTTLGGSWWLADDRFSDDYQLVFVRKVAS